ncbi:hypothetical protein SPRG_17242 [Saprolegnia parasitica CBS 223.65]|uniref:Restriction endonuclease domain-containing protein n=1 Tax=Saprolegnia parasitica (strain CBS 223.65) TaxID=695850 RepID=A0A067BSQ8_SAPPC|nr:hypothetical protein SPRG_17242 [Saprolegnia parasitica CBS 223.65]KDO17321.1 hypothetical protein SPRG_17242 [Saprolegnia parasitica CBS 223.65]|eukprot:XP_012211974.1 hypothetical protein SPRG_17242 [Saprolegnia parasitica CBS 223.65]
MVTPPTTATTNPETIARASVDPVGAINRAIEALDWDGAQAALDVIDNDGFRVCSATEADWERYVESEDQEMKSRHFEFRDDSIYLVEMSGGLHPAIAGGIDDAIKEATRPKATGTDHRVLEGHRDAYVDTTFEPAASKLPKLSPDCSFGPAMETDAIFPDWPDDLRWNEFHTLKVEVGINEGWRSMNRKVVQYCRFPGLRYVLCVFVSPDMEVRQYKLFSITNNELEGPDPALVNPSPITVDTRVRMDGRRLLALPDDTALPGRFPAELVLELNPILRRAWVRCRSRHNRNPPPF